MRVFLRKGCALLLVLSLATAAQSAPLTFEQVVERVMQGSPIMGAQHASQRESEGLIQQAGASPNPTLQFQSQTDAFERLSLIGLAVSQPIELGHKRQSRLRVAESEKQEAYWETEVRRRTLRRELHERFARVLMAQARQQIAEDMAQTTGRHLEIARGRWRAGDASGVEVQAIEIESQRRLAVKVLAEGELRKALASLGEHLFGPEQPLAQGVTGQLGWRHPLPALEALGATDQASLQLAQARIQTGENKVTLERSKGVSDLTVQAGVFLQRDYFPGTSFQPEGMISKLDDSGPILQLQLQIPLPFNDDNSGNIAAAQARLERSRLETEALEHKMRAEIEGLYHTLTAQTRARELLESSVLPASKRTLETVEKAYALGFRSQVDLLLAREAYLRAAEDAVQAAFDESLTLADLEALLGRSLPVDTPPTEPAQPLPTETQDP